MRYLFTVPLVAVAIGIPAGADGCVPTTSQPEITTCPLGVEIVYACEYVDNDLCQFKCAFSVWFYEESNAIPGLQRGDEVVDDTCGGAIEADTIWS